MNNEVISSSTGTTFTIDSDDVNYIRVKDQSGNTGRYIIPGYSAPPSDEVNISEIVTENAPAIGIGAIILAAIGAVVAKVKKKGSKKKKGKKKKSNKRK